MKKNSQYTAHRTSLLDLKQRKRKGAARKGKNRLRSKEQFASERNRWVERKIREGLNFSIDNHRRVTVFLPEKMNFSTQYEITTQYSQAIRRLAEKPKHESQYRLASVDFSMLKSISTSAALVLTAELARWEDNILFNLNPNIDRWDPEIARRFYDLGFFDLFKCNIDRGSIKGGCHNGSLSIVRYIKKQKVGVSQVRDFKKELIDCVETDIEKWVILKSGIDEAINNVADHAYPDGKGFSEKDKNWYLTGSYNKDTGELKVVFYDQGIGIPSTLPVSKFKEHVLEFLSRKSFAKGNRDEMLLKAAVEVSRTRTGKEDRGQGLPDMLDFIKERKNGYLSIMSGRGLYKYTVEGGKAKNKGASFNNRIYGTLIIWRTLLSA